MEIREVFTNYGDAQVYSVGIRFKYESKAYRACVDFEEGQGPTVNIFDANGDAPLYLNEDVNSQLISRALQYQGS